MVDDEIKAAPVAVRDLDLSEMDAVTGAAHSLGDTIHRILFAVGCVLDGNTLSVHGDQLHCTIK